MCKVGGSHLKAPSKKEILDHPIFFHTLVLKFYIFVFKEIRANLVTSECYFFFQSQNWLIKSKVFFK